MAAVSAASESPISPFNLTRSDQRMEHVRPRHGPEYMWRAESVRQQFDFLEGGERRGVLAACQLDAGADVVELEPGDGILLWVQDALGVIDPGLRLRHTSLRDEGGGVHRMRDGGNRFVVPSVASRELDRLQAEPGTGGVRPGHRELRFVHQSSELQIGPADPPRQGYPLLQVPVRAADTQCGRLGAPRAEQGHRAQPVADTQTHRIGGLDRHEQRSAASATAGRSPRLRAIRRRRTMHMTSKCPRPA